MSRFFKTIVLPLLCIAVVCIGSVEGFYYWFDRHVENLKRHEHRRSVQAAPVAPVRGRGGKDVGAAEGYAVIIQRNLFSATTGAGVEPLARDPLEGVEASSLDVVLMGTISGTEDGVRAIIYDKSEKKQELYQVGDYIQQAVIKKILRGKVILNYDGRDEMLDISEARNVAVPKVAAVSPVVVRQRVMGRPIGRPSNDNQEKPDAPTGTPPTE